jgi:hypothetical protein
MGKALFSRNKSDYSSTVEWEMRIGTQANVNVIARILTLFLLHQAMAKSRSFHLRICSAYAQHTLNNLRRATKLYVLIVIGPERFGHVRKLEKKGGRWDRITTLERPDLAQTVRNTWFGVSLIQLT